MNESRSHDNVPRGSSNKDKEGIGNYCNIIENLKKSKLDNFCNFFN